MALVLVVEDGTGLANANSYCSQATALSYHEAHSDDAQTVWEALSSAQKDKHLVWATRLLDQWVAWEGTRYSSTQALAWPRSGALDEEGEDIDEDVVPTRVAHATAELARILSGDPERAEDDEVGLRRVGNLEFDKGDRPKVVPKSVRAFFLVGYGKVRGVGPARSTERV